VLPADVIAEAVTAAIFIEAATEPAQALPEVRWVSQLDWPTLAGIVAGADLRSDGLANHLDTLTDSDFVVGVRHLLQGESADSIADLSLTVGLRLLGERGLTFDACVTHGQLGALAVLLDSVAETRVVIDHLGKPPVDAGLESCEGQAWAHAIGRLSDRDTTFIKLSGLSVESRSAETYAREAPAFVAHALKCFGVNRCMVGSDAPVSTRLGSGGSFSDWLALVRGVVGDRDWTAASRGTATRFYLRGAEVNS
jgi:L-fuconolactonase